jgi:hypothetical protein
MKISKENYRNYTEIWNRITQTETRHSAAFCTELAHGMSWDRIQSSDVSGLRLNTQRKEILF